MRPTDTVLTKQLLTISREVQDIPYGTIGSSDYRDVLRLNRGTCSGKHALLKYYLEEAGIRVRTMAAVHSFADLPVKYPAELANFLKENPFLDAHNFLEAKVDGRWIAIDITWDPALQPLGFETNGDWDGYHSMLIGVVARKTMAIEDPASYKEAFLEGLTEDARRSRAQFLEMLNSWLKEYRQKIRTHSTGSKA